MLEIDGQRTVPSIVAFTEKDYLVGKPAKAQVGTGTGTPILPVSPTSPSPARASLPSTTRCMHSCEGYLKPCREGSQEGVFVAQMFLNPTNTVYDAKRLVGRKFSEQDVQDDLANMNWPFAVRRGSGDKPTIRGTQA